MDAAYGIASSPPQNPSSSTGATVCGVCGLPYTYTYMYSPVPNEGDDGHDDDPNGDGHAAKCCTCCAVAFLIPECKRSTVRFPLRCSAFDATDDHEEDDDRHRDEDDRFSREERMFQRRMKLLERPSRKTRPTRRRTRSSYLSKDRTVLERIGVRYLKSRADLMLFLASVHSLPPGVRPWGGIVVDDLDRFVRKESVDGGGGALESRRLVQICE